MAAKYSRLTGECADQDDADLGRTFTSVEMTQSTKDDSSSKENELILKILHKEKAFELKGFNLEGTISELKTAVESLTEVPKPQQRLIHAGKPLKPDDKTLRFFKVSNNASIHLFPIPQSAVASAIQQNQPNSNRADTATEILNPLATNRNNQPEIVHLPIHFDPYINQSTREVKLWSYILVFLSTMTLINNLSFFASTARLGFGYLDSFVTVLETLCSIGGLWVGQLGLTSAHTVDFELTKKYVKWLIVLAIFSVGMRIAWVFDMVEQVKVAVKNSQKHAPSPGSDSVNAPSGGPQPPVLDDKVVETFAIQASLICLVCVFAWVNCVVRAVRLRNAVQTYNEAMHV